jgi:Trk K+ transport system NAD-binding subunit
MSDMGKRVWIRIAITARQNRAALAFVAAWLLVNGLLFARVFELPGRDAALAAICLHKVEGSWGRFYASFTELVVFGAVASMIAANATRRYRPEATCAALAERARSHLVIVGHTNLGKRIRAMALEAGAEVVVVDDDRARVEELIQAEAPLVIGSAEAADTLKAARVERAAVVVLATDDLETAAVACRIVRAENPRCKLVVRCPDDDVGQLLAKAYSARVLSTSRLAARFILERAQKAGVRRAVVLGPNSVGKRVAEALAGASIGCAVAPETDDLEALRKAGVEGADLVVIADDDLGKNLVRVDRLRDLAPEALVMCRAFHDDAAEILTQKPFRCQVLSTSRLAAEVLANEGVFKGVGVAKAPVKKGKRAAGSPAASTT